MNKKKPSIKYYSTQLGDAYLGDSVEFVKSLPDDSINLILTSPPFALVSKKEYGNEKESKYVDWFMSFAPDLHRLLKEDGSLVIDLGGAYIPGSPTRSIYQFELLIRLIRESGFYLAQEFFHYNPARLPSPAQWVNVKRVRVKDSVNVVWWLSKSENPKASNRNILKPYGEDMKKLIKSGLKKTTRPSGHSISTMFSKDNGGAIPSNLLELPNTDSNSSYLVKCREAGIRLHPARFPPGFPEFFIKFLSQENDVVFDMFAGSNTTGFVAEKLGRRWIASELSKDYLDGSLFRFDPDSITKHP